MRLPSVPALTAVGLALVAVGEAATATYDSKLVGTWSTKSNQTLTGPSFYNPVTDDLIEPNRTGISYSFTSDGFYEEAYYRAISNPADPSCPSAIMQWQHGTYTINTNGSLSLTPFAVDGRQLLSEPCQADTSTYTRYNQSETFEAYVVETDPYHGIQRLNLHEFDGTIMQPMYLVYSPPQMLPTITLNPTTAVAGATTVSNPKRVKRSLRVNGDRMFDVPINRKMGSGIAGDDMGGSGLVAQAVVGVDADWWWWVGLTMTGVGGLMYFGPRRMGIQI